MTDELMKRFNECIKAIPHTNHETPESVDKSALEAAKTKKLHGIYKELSNLNRILSRRR